MNYRGRQIDPLAFWSQYVEFHAKVDSADEFTPLVQCPNPDHDTLKSHFQVNLREPMVHCFARCGISGSYEHAVCMLEGLYEKFKVEEPKDERERNRRKRRAYREARRIILRGSRTGSKLHRTASVRKSSAAKVVSADALHYELFLPPLALEYLTERGISSKSIAEWQLGWLSEERRIVIPGQDENGRLRFLIKRAVSERQIPKYLYSEGFPKTSLLFGAGHLDLGMISSSGLILVEGSLDVIRLHQHGLRNVGAILGTGISEQQARIVARLSPPRIYLFFDKDTAGIRNIEMAVPMLRKYPLFVVRYPSGKSDPAVLTEKEAHRQISRAVPAMQFVRDNGLNVTTKRS